MLSCYGRQTMARWFQKTEENFHGCGKQIKEEYKNKNKTEPATEAEAVSNKIFRTLNSKDLEKDLKHNAEIIIICVYEFHNGFC